MTYKNTIPLHEEILKKTKTSKISIKKYNFYLDDENIPIQDALQKVDDYPVSKTTRNRIRRYLEKIYEIYNITPGNDEAIITPEKQQEILKKYETIDPQTPTVPKQECKTEEQEELEQHDIKKTYEKIKQLNENIKQLKREQKKQEQDHEYQEFLHKYENITQKNNNNKTIGEKQTCP